MDANISETELRLLVWMHENKRACGPVGAWYAGNVATAVGTELSALTQDASYLQGHGLVGGEFTDMTDNSSDEPERSFVELWLTSAGENYVRAIEKQPGIAGRLTVETLSTLGDIAVKTASSVLADFLRLHR